VSLETCELLESRSRLHWRQSDFAPTRSALVLIRKIRQDTWHRAYGVARNFKWICCFAFKTQSHDLQKRYEWRVLKLILLNISDAIARPQEGDNVCGECHQILRAIFLICQQKPFIHRLSGAEVRGVCRRMLCGYKDDESS
jgi:hypothetical protein